MTTTQIHHRTLPDFVHIPNRHGVHGLDEVLVTLRCSTARESLRDVCMAVCDLVGLEIEAPRRHVLGAINQRGNPHLSMAGAWGWTLPGGTTISVDEPRGTKTIEDRMTFSLGHARPKTLTFTIGAESETMTVEDFLAHLNALGVLARLEYVGGVYTRYSTPAVRAA